MVRDNFLAVIVIALVFLLSLVLGGAYAHASDRGLPEQRPRVMVADYIIVEKAARRMTLFNGQRKIKSYRISLGKGGLAPKTRQGDKRTPEGRYYISGRNPNSNYHLSLRISYPDRADRARAASLGVSAGGDIMIHGIGPGLTWWERQSYPFKDWTAGCIAVTDKEIEEIWRLVPNGAVIDIRK